MQQLETIQKTIEPLQDAILRLALLASTTTAENTLGELNNSLTELRKSDKELRDRLFVVQVAHRYDWVAANKVARRKAGEYDDPELTKVLEEREKKEEKQNERERKKDLVPSPPPMPREAGFTMKIQVVTTGEATTRVTTARLPQLTTKPKDEKDLDGQTVSGPGSTRMRKSATTATRRVISGEIAPAKSNT